MLEVKCFTFSTMHTIDSENITKIVEDIYEPIITINHLDSSPSLKFICTNPSINEFDADDMLRGFFSNVFDPISHEIIKKDKSIIIKSIFVLQFSPDCQISLNNDEILYIEGDRHYSYKIFPSFCRVDCPALTDAVDIPSEKTLAIEMAIKELIM